MDRYVLGTMSEKLRRVIKQCLWENYELTQKNVKLRDENDELREELDQADTANGSKPGHDFVRPKISRGTLNTVSQRGISETGTSHAEADLAKYAVDEGYGVVSQRVNSPLSQSPSCGSGWADVQGLDVEKEWPYTWWCSDVIVYLGANKVE